MRYVAVSSSDYSEQELLSNIRYAKSLGLEAVPSGRALGALAGRCVDELHGKRQNIRCKEAA